MIGLGRMGGNIVRRLMKNGHTAVVYDKDPKAVAALAADGAAGASSLEDFVQQAGEAAHRLGDAAGRQDHRSDHRRARKTDAAGDVIIDGGNTFWQDDVRRGKALKERGIHYVDVGTTGGVWGIERGYCMMIGGDKAVVDRLDPIFAALAPGIGDIPRTAGREGRDPRIEQGYIHAGPVGAGHFVKMIHNGIEYGLMQAYAEGFDILKNANIDALPAEHRFDLDIADIAEVWRRGSVIPSWLLDLTASALAENQTLDNYSGFVEDSGEGRWTVNAAIDEAVPAEVLTAALFARFRSRKEHTFAEKILSAMRDGFGGHKEPPEPKPGRKGLRSHHGGRSSSKQKKPDPCSFVIFGVTGDLTHRLVIPALYNLAANRSAAGQILRRRRRPQGDVERRAARQPDEGPAPIRDAPGGRCDRQTPARMRHLHRGRSERPGLVRRHARAARQARGRAQNRRQPAVLSGDAAERVSCRSASELGRTGMLKENGAWRRLVVEKPFGTDLASAKALNGELLKLVDEHQIYRIDHYLGKETVQNILVLRFANGMFEPIWNRNHIDHVQITVDEKLGVGHRGSFYDATGALRDMVPNHLFQLLSLVAMEPPAQFDAHSVRSEKAEVLAAIQTQSEEEALQQFGARAISGRQDRRHRDRRLSQDRGRQARQHHRDLCRAEADHRQLALGRRAVLPAHRQGARRQAHRDRDQVQAGAVRDVPRHAGGPAVAELSWSSRPSRPKASRCSSTPRCRGPTIAIDGVEMKFRYKDYFKAEPSTGYETLIYDCMIGDNILFQRADSVEAGWQAVQPFLDAWKKAGGKGLKVYEAGSEGPEEANELLERDGRSWRKLT